MKTFPLKKNDYLIHSRAAKGIKEDVVNRTRQCKNGGSLLKFCLQTL